MTLPRTHQNFRFSEARDLNWICKDSDSGSRWICCSARRWPRDDCKKQETRISLVPGRKTTKTSNFVTNNKYRVIIVYGIINGETLVSGRSASQPANHSCCLAQLKEQQQQSSVIIMRRDSLHLITSYGGTKKTVASRMTMTVAMMTMPLTLPPLLAPPKYGTSIIAPPPLTIRRRSSAAKKIP